MITDASDTGVAESPHDALLVRVRKGVRFVVLAAVVWVVALIAVAVFVGDRAAFARLDRAGPAIATMTLAAFAVNHLIRYARWQWMLRLLGAKVPGMASLAIFMAGLGLLPTPGKIGVAARSLLLIRYRVPIRASLAAYFAERLFDLAGLLILAAAFYRGPLSSGLTAISIAALIFIALLVRYPDRLLAALRRLATKWPRALYVLDATSRMLDEASRLLAFPQVLIFVVLGAIANIAVGLLVFGLALNLGAPIPVDTGIGAISFAHLSGSASMTPGGLGSFEAALLLDLEHSGVAPDNALIVVTCVRIVTLWGGIAVGLPLLLVGLKRSGFERRK